MHKSVEMAILILIPFLQREIILFFTCSLLTTWDEVLEIKLVQEKIKSSVQNKQINFILLTLFPPPGSSLIT